MYIFCITGSNWLLGGFVCVLMKIVLSWFSIWTNDDDKWHAEGGGALKTSYWIYKDTWNNYVSTVTFPTQMFQIICSCGAINKEYRSGRQERRDVMMVLKDTALHPSCFWRGNVKPAFSASTHTKIHTFLVFFPQDRSQEQHTHCSETRPIPFWTRG